MMFRVYCLLNAESRISSTQVADLQDETFFHPPIHHGNTSITASSKHLLSLMLRQGHGYTLWLPEPISNLPPDCVCDGTPFGDLGYLADSGRFDYLFNIFMGTLRILLIRISIVYLLVLYRSRWILVDGKDWSSTIGT
ncbi:uncharacterized protein EV420DRAFT_1560601 [Desarmillaria tabescens]|uniref:Uncharacterized protein n=1 Tax=Armillaria tabescens TaxID=1929756 RepID=A0AA39K0Y2_ARMTA|nr:uncharacterized protein EV420DRAFT_1560601 [Desarmillaria tabescens]KAK0451361.1 hypothetical protein EV420DRAFT_1560601 [Desarmillaria tabescens]